VFGCILTVLYVGLIVKVGKSIRGMWCSMTRGGVGDGDSDVCVTVGNMRGVARECSLGLYVGVSMCKLVLCECVTYILLVFCKYDAIAWEL